MSRAQFTVAISTDEEAAASKRMVPYAFSAQINLFTSFFLMSNHSLPALGIDPPFSHKIVVSMSSSIYETFHISLHIHSLRAH